MQASQYARNRMLGSGGTTFAAVAIAALIWSAALAPAMAQSGAAFISSSTAIQRLNVESGDLATVARQRMGVLGVAVNASGSTAYVLSRHAALPGAESQPVEYLGVDMATGEVFVVATSAYDHSLGTFFNQLALVPRPGNQDEVLAVSRGVVGGGVGIIETDLRTGDHRVVVGGVGPLGHSIRVGGDGSRIYISSHLEFDPLAFVRVFDRLSGSLLGTIWIPPDVGAVWDFDIDAAEETMYVLGIDAQSIDAVHVLDITVDPPVVVNSHFAGVPRGLGGIALDEPRGALYAVGALVPGQAAGLVRFDINAPGLNPQTIGLAPRTAMAVTPDGAKVLSGDRGLFANDVQTGERKPVSDVDSHPWGASGIACAAETGEIFIADGRGIARVNVASGLLERITTPASSLLVPSSPRLAVTADGRSGYVAGSGAAVRINLETGEVDDPFAGLGLGGRGIAVTADGTVLYTTHGNPNFNTEIVRVDLTATPLQAVPIAIVSNGVNGLALSPDEMYLYYARGPLGLPRDRIHRIDLATYEDTFVTVNFTPRAIVIPPPGSHAYVLQNGPGPVHFVDLSTGATTTVAGVSGNLSDIIHVNTADGANVTVQPFDTITGEQPVSLTFENITVAGDTTVASSTEGFDPPTGFQVGDGQLYFEITTTASYDGQITICIDYSSVDYIDESNLFLFHYKDGAWQNITTSVDTTSQVICGTTDSLSPFAVFELQPGLTAAGLLEMLVDDVAILNLQHGINNSLDVKLDRALDALDKARNNYKTQAVNAIESFILEVEAQSGQMIPAGAAAALVDTALIVIELIQNG